jgi:hypothetical protein
MCVGDEAFMVEGVCRRARKSRHGRERREKGLKVALKEEMVWSGRGGIVGKR